MAESISSASPASVGFGKLLGDYPGSAFRFIWVILWAALAAWCVLGNLVQGSFGGVVFGLVLGAGCYAYYQYYARYEVHAQLFEHGFVLSRGGKTTSARWEDVANVEHSVRTWRYYGVIPLSRSHSYRVTLSSGSRVKVTSSFSKQRELGDTMQRMWADAALTKRARTLMQQQAAQQAPGESPAS